MNSTSIAVLIGLAFIGGALWFTSPSPSQDLARGDGQNVRIVDGTQIITISAKGGYSPRVTSAQAGIPTVLTVETAGTFDCSAALTIPAIRYGRMLPPSGETQIPLPPQKAGKTIQGLCSMGMYNFTINFN